MVASVIWADRSTLRRVRPSAAGEPPGSGSGPATDGLAAESDGADDLLRAADSPAPVDGAASLAADPPLPPATRSRPRCPARRADDDQGDEAERRGEPSAGSVSFGHDRPETRRGTRGKPRSTRESSGG